MTDTKGLEQSIRIIGKGIGKRSNVIFTITAIGGVIALVYFTDKAALQARDDILEYEGKIWALLEAEKRSLTIKEKFKACWKRYILVAVSGVLTIGSIILLNKVYLDREASILGLYTITNAAYQEYQNKVREKLGEKKESEVREEINQDHIQKGNSQIIVAGGESLFYDNLSGRYFTSNIETIRSVVNEFNRDLLTEMYKTLNEFYAELRLEPVDVGSMGWHIDTGLLDIQYSSKLTPDGKACIVLTYRNGPRPL